MTTGSALADMDPSLPVAPEHRSSRPVDVLWVLTGFMVPAVVVGATVPLLLHRLGASTYGIVVVALAGLQLLTIGPSGVAVALGRDVARSAARADRKATTAAFATALILTEVLAGAAAVAVHLLASRLVVGMGLPVASRGQAVEFVRIIGLSLLVACPNLLLISVLTAHRRYRAANAASAVSALLQGAGTLVVLLAVRDRPLVCLAFVQVAGSAVACGLLLALAARDLEWRQMPVLSWAWSWTFLRSAAHVSAVGAAAAVDQNSDGVLLGPFVSSRAAAAYGAGAQLPGFLRAIPLSVLTPATVELRHLHATVSAEVLHASYVRLQHWWVRLSTGVSAVALGSIYFAVVSWLGPANERAGEVAVILVTGDAVNLWTAALTAYLLAIGRSAVEARYGLLAAAVNLALTAPALLGGLVPVVCATSIGEVAGSLALIGFSRRALGPERAVRSFLRDVPWRAGFATAVGVALVEWATTPLRPGGIPGLLTAGAPAVLGLALYAILELGVRDPRELVRSPSLT